MAKVAKKNKMDALTEGLQGVLPENKKPQQTPRQTAKEGKNISIAFTTLEYEKLKTFYKMLGLNFSAGMKHAARHLILTTTDEQILRCYISALEKQGIETEDVEDQLNNLRRR